MVRLGVFADLVYRRCGQTISTDLSVIQFLTGLASDHTAVVVFGRLDPRPGSGPHKLPQDGVKFVPLPHYPSVWSLGRLARAAPAAMHSFRGQLDELDAVWVFGPHPFALPFLWMARRRGKVALLGVRQDYPRYVQTRLPGTRWIWVVPLAWALELSFRLLSRRLPAVVVGEQLARRYGRGRTPPLAISFSLIGQADIVGLHEALHRSWEGPLRLLSVGRLDREKNPLLLAEVLAGLRARDERWHLTVAGEGPLTGALERRAVELGVADALELRGYIPYGPDLRSLYTSSNAFLHVSHTEGVPQVLLEAHSAGLPIVATAVGGVAEALGGGARGLLVPPADASAAVEALERLRGDEGLRRNLVEAGLDYASRHTQEIQLERLRRFLELALRR